MNHPKEKPFPLDKIIEPAKEAKYRRAFFRWLAGITTLSTLAIYGTLNLLNPQPVDAPPATTLFPTQPTAPEATATPKSGQKISNPEFLLWQYQREWSEFDHWLTEQGISTPRP